MKRVMRLLARIYPASWRERYGAEFDALLEDAKPSARAAIDLLWGALNMQLKLLTPVKTIVGFSGLGAFVSVGVFLILPFQYAARDRIVVSSAGEPASFAVQHLMEQGIFDRQSLASIIHERGLYSRDRGRLSEDEVINKMRRSIRLLAVRTDLPSKDAAFDLQFDYPDPDVAKQVDRQLIELLLDRALAQNLSSGTFEKSDWVTRVIHLPTVSRSPRYFGVVRFACFGSFTGFLTGLLFAALIKWRTVNSTPGSN